MEKNLKSNGTMETTNAPSNKWVFHEKYIQSVEDIPECCPFFVYKIQFLDGTYYYGYKQVYSVTNPKISKKKAKELYTGKGSYKKKLRTVKESDWLTYQTSSKTVQEKLKTEKASFYIIDFYSTKAEALGREAQLILNDFLNKEEKILNLWLSIKIFKPKN